MEIKYVSDFIAKNKSYSVGSVNVWSGFALQLLELRPRLSEGKLAPGEKCMILFGITKEEHDRKDTDPQALDQLAAEFRERVPGDRLIAVLITDLTNKPVQKTIKLATGESIDNGAFIGTYRVKPGPIDPVLVAARKLQNIASKKDAPTGVREDWGAARKAAAEALSALDKVYVPYDKIMRARYPYVRDGRVEIFTTPERANKAMSAMQKFNFNEDAWDIREIPSSEISPFLDRCAEMGLNSLRVDAASLDVLLFIKDICERETPRNAALRGCMLQEVTCGAQLEKLKNTEMKEPERRRLVERVMTMRNFTQRELGNSILWALCAPEGKTNGQLCTENARQKMDGAPGMQVVSGRNCIILGRKDNEAKYLGAFTSEIRALSFAEKVNTDPKPVAMTFDDLTGIVRANQQTSGLLIDVEDYGYRLSKDQFDNVMKLRDLPPQIVKIKAPEPAQPAVKEPAEPKAESAPVLPDPDAGSLPDPDAFDVPVKTAETEAEKTQETDQKAEQEAKQETAENEKTKKKNGGFFGKLFGKGKK